jgi:hypothetical protein
VKELERWPNKWGEVMPERAVNGKLTGLAVPRQKTVKEEVTRTQPNLLENQSKKDQNVVPLNMVEIPR